MFSCFRDVVKNLSTNNRELKQRSDILMLMLFRNKETVKLATFCFAMYGKHQSAARSDCIWSVRAYAAFELRESLWLVLQIVNLWALIGAWNNHCQVSSFLSWVTAWTWECYFSVKVLNKNTVHKVTSSVKTELQKKFVLAILRMYTITLVTRFITSFTNLDKNLVGRGFSMW